MGRPKRKAPSKEELNHFTWIEDHVAASSLAFKENNSSDLDDDIKLSEGWHHYKTIDATNGLRYKIWVSPSNGNVLVSFRGTQSIKEALIDATFGSTTFKSAKGIDIGHVYKGFGDAWNQMSEQMTAEMRYLQNTTFLKDGSTLQFTGHSLGGAMADLASTFYADMFPNVQVIETSIAAPASGDIPFVTYASKQENAKRTRIVSPGDPVANIKLSGMQYMITPYVIDVGMSRDKKKQKLGLYDAFKVMAGTVNPVIGLVLGANELMDQHALDTYGEKLANNFKSGRVQSVDNPEAQLQKKEDDRIRLKDSSMPITDGSCACECHNYDEAVSNNQPIPESLGTIQQSQAPARVALQTTDAMDIHGQVYNSAGQQVQQTDQDQLNSQAQDMIDTTADADNSNIQDLVNAALDKQSQKDEEALNKLQDKYSTLTNQDIADEDPVTQSREAYSRHEDDMNYYNSRIEEELENPNLVPNDNPLDNASGTTARDTAIKFKNSLNQLYASIMSRQSYEDSRQLDTTLTDQDRADDGTSAAITDQGQDAIPQAQADDMLDDEHQSGDYVFDYHMLGDVMNLSDAGKAQLTEWLAYPGVTEGSLYENLKKQMVADYKTTRMDALVLSDNELKSKSVDDLREKITKQESDIRLNTQQREQYIRQLTSNDDFKSMLASGQVNLDKIVASYKGKDSELTMSNEILGYDPATRNQTLLSEYEEGVREIQNQMLSPEETGKAMAQLADTYGILEDIPWLDKADIDRINREHRVEGGDREKALQEFVEEKRNARGSAYRGEESKVTVDLSKDAAYNYDYRDEIKDGVYEDGWAQREKELDEVYSDPEKLKALFEQWNKGDKTTEKNISDTVVNGLLGGPFNPLFWSSVDNLNRDSHTGWFTGDGKRLGVNASPDFVRYVSEHPELGIHYIDGGGHNPYVEKINGVYNSVVGLAMGAEFGVPMGPQDAANLISGIAGFDSKGPSGTMGVLDGYLGSYRQGPTETEAPNKAEEQIMEMAQMAAMMAFQRGSRTTTKGSGMKPETEFGPFKPVPKAGVGGETTGKMFTPPKSSSALNQVKETFNKTKTSIGNAMSSVSNKVESSLQQKKNFSSLMDETDLAIPVTKAEKPPSLYQRASGKVKSYAEQRQQRKLDEIYKRHQVRVEKQPNLNFKFSKIE